MSAARTAPVKARGRVITHAVAGAAERGEERVALGVDLVAVPDAELLPQDAAMFRKEVGVLASQSFEESGRALDVREEEGDGARRGLEFRFLGRRGAFSPGARDSRTRVHAWPPKLLVRMTFLSRQLTGPGDDRPIGQILRRAMRPEGPPLAPVAVPGKRHAHGDDRDDHQKERVLAEHEEDREHRNEEDAHGERRRIQHLQSQADDLEDQDVQSDERHAHEPRKDVAVGICVVGEKQRQRELRDEQQRHAGDRQIRDDVIQAQAGQSMS